MPLLGIDRSGVVRDTARLTRTFVRSIIHQRQFLYKKRNGFTDNERPGNCFAVSPHSVVKVHASSSTWHVFMAYCPQRHTPGIVALIQRVDKCTHFYHKLSYDAPATKTVHGDHMSNSVGTTQKAFTVAGPEPLHTAHAGGPVSVDELRQKC